MILKRAVLILAFAIVACDAQDGSQAISVRIAPDSQVCRDFGDAVLEIDVTNVSDHLVSVETRDYEPPVSVSGLNQRGRSALIETHPVKDGTQRTRQYELKAKETKTYRVAVRDMLRKYQKLAKPEAGNLDVKVTFGYVNADFTVTLIDSNVVKIEIAP
jgi:hypothetical protein